MTEERMEDKWLETQSPVASVQQTVEGKQILSCKFLFLKDLLTDPARYRQESGKGEIGQCQSRLGNP